jgi:hypothetical protein
MCDVMELRPDLRTVHILVMEPTTVFTLKMLELVVDVFKVPSDFKEVMLLVAAWRSATTIPGAQCVRTGGTIKMLESSAGS